MTEFNLKAIISVVDKVAGPMKGIIRALGRVGTLVDLPFPEAFGMRNDVLGLSTRIPADAGQAGTGGGNLPASVADAAKMVVVFDASTGAAGTPGDNTAMPFMLPLADAVGAREERTDTVAKLGLDTRLATAMPTVPTIIQKLEESVRPAVFDGIFDLEGVGAIAPAATNLPLPQGSNAKVGPPPIEAGVRGAGSDGRVNSPAVDLMPFDHQRTAFTVKLGSVALPTLSVFPALPGVIAGQANGFARTNTEPTRFAVTPVADVKVTALEVDRAAPWAAGSKISANPITSVEPPAGVTALIKGDRRLTFTQFTGGLEAATEGAGGGVERLSGNVAGDFGGAVGGLPRISGVFRHIGVPSWQPGGLAPGPIGGERPRTLNPILPDWAFDMPKVTVAATAAQVATAAMPGPEGPPGAPGVSHSAVAPAPAGVTPVLAAGDRAVRLTGEMNVKFDGAPPGMRVEPMKTNQPDVDSKVHVGYRSLAMGT